MRGVRRGARPGRGSASTTTSSTWAGTRCSRPGWSAGSGRCSGSSWRSGRCSRRPTVAGLAGAAGRAPGRRAAGAGARGTRPERVPLSFAQQRLWFLDQLEGPSATYNMPVALRLARRRWTGPRWRRRCGDVVGRHEALRTVFPAADGRAVPAGPRPGRAGLASCGGRPVAAAELDAAVAAAARPRVRPGGARCRCGRGCSTAGPDEHVLVLVLHHIAGDGWSMAPLARDLSTAYAARCAGRAPEWAPLPVQYADYALWQRELLGGEDDPDSLLARQVGVLARGAGRGCRRSWRCRPTGRARRWPAYRGARVRVRRCPPSVHARLARAGPGARA